MPERFDGEQKELTSKEKLEKLDRSFVRIGMRHLLVGGRGISGTEDYTLINKRLGNSTTENSILAAFQFDFALALSPDPLVENFVETEHHLGGTDSERSEQFKRT